MKNIFLTILIIFSLSPLSLTAQEQIVKEIDKLLGEYDKQELFSGVVLLAADGTPVYQKAFGYADWENKIPNNISTLFNIGSINKDFVKILILQLEQEGKLNRADLLGKHLQLFNTPQAEKITIQMLLDMRAGLGDFLRNPAYNRNAQNIITVDDFLNVIKDEPLLYEPGTEQRYSNSGYVVLGGVIEKVTGKTFEQNIQERILIPLGINDTYYSLQSVSRLNTASGTIIKFSGEKVTSPFSLPTSPAGGIYSNVHDLLKFNSLMRQKFIGTGVFAGGTPVWNSIIGQYQSGYTLVVLSNFGGMAEEVEQRIRLILKGEPYPAPEPPFEMRLYSLLKQNGYEAFKAQYKDILNSARLQLIPMHLNSLGYSLMQAGELDMAIQVFQYNVQLFPDVPNMYDSLGEAYMNKGDKDLAISYYQKVLQMEPGNKNAREKLEQLTR